MPRFTVKERDAGEACFIAEEDKGLFFELNPPADLEYAKMVAKVLNESVREIMFDTTRFEFPSESLMG